MGDVYVQQEKRKKGMLDQQLSALVNACGNRATGRRHDAFSQILDSTELSSGACGSAWLNDN